MTKREDKLQAEKQHRAPGAAAPACSATRNDVDTSKDAFLGGKVRALQFRTGYRAGTDAVMLAAAVPALAGRGERVLDAGAGVGVASLCLAARIDDLALTLVEREPSLCELARENMQRNGFATRATIVEGNLTGPAAALTLQGLELDCHDHVFANPPYFLAERSTPAAGQLRAGARAMEAGALEHWARFFAATARPGGTMTMIYPAEGLGALLSVLLRRFGALHILPIHSRFSDYACRVIVHGIKGSRAPLRVLPGFIMHDESGGYTRRAEEILRHGAGLSLVP